MKKLIFICLVVLHLQIAANEQYETDLLTAVKSNNVRKVHDLLIEAKQKNIKLSLDFKNKALEAVKNVLKTNPYEYAKPNGFLEKIKLAFERVGDFAGAINAGLNGSSFAGRDIDKELSPREKIIFASIISATLGTTLYAIYIRNNSWEEIKAQIAITAFGAYIFARISEFNLKLLMLGKYHFSSKFAKALSIAYLIENFESAKMGLS